MTGLCSLVIVSLAFEPLFIYFLKSSFKSLVYMALHFVLLCCGYMFYLQLETDQQISWCNDSICASMEDACWLGDGFISNCSQFDIMKGFAYSTNNGDSGKEYWDDSSLHLSHTGYMNPKHLIVYLKHL